VRSQPLTKSEREAAAKRLETAKVKHRDLLNLQVVFSRLAGTRNIETRSKLRLEIRRRVERITFWFRRSADSPPFGRRCGERAVSIRRSPLHERECRYIVLAKGVIMMLP
jgi:hypothetical protein